MHRNTKRGSMPAKCPVKYKIEMKPACWPNASQYETRPDSNLTFQHNPFAYVHLIDLIFKFSQMTQKITFKQRHTVTYRSRCTISRYIDGSQQDIDACRPNARQHETDKVQELELFAQCLRLIHRIQAHITLKDDQVCEVLLLLF